MHGKQIKAQRNLQAELENERLEHSKTRKELYSLKIENQRLQHNVDNAINQVTSAFNGEWVDSVGTHCASIAMPNMIEPTGTVVQLSVRGDDMIVFREGGEDILGKLPGRGLPTCPAGPVGPACADSSDTLHAHRRVSKSPTGSLAPARL